MVTNFPGMKEIQVTGRELHSPPLPEPVLPPHLCAICWQLGPSYQALAQLLRTQCHQRPSCHRVDSCGTYVWHFQSCFSDCKRLLNNRAVITQPVPPCARGKTHPLSRPDVWLLSSTYVVMSTSFPPGYHRIPLRKGGDSQAVVLWQTVRQPAVWPHHYAARYDMFSLRGFLPLKYHFTNGSSTFPHGN